MLVAALTPEPATGDVQSWLGAADPARLAISDWVSTEISSALALKVRTGALDPARQARALAVYQQMVADSFALLPITPGSFHVAARFADRHELGVRAGDALHLAVVQAHGAALVTLDRRLAEAAAALGVAVEPL